jgi:Janus/Ocnus family (Ocnus).
VEIDEGTFKYIQIQGKSKSTGEKIIFIRGYKRCPYHADVLDEFLADVKKIQSIQPILIKGKDGKEVEIINDVSFNSPGGGRIEHSGNKAIVLFMV